MSIVQLAAEPASDECLDGAYQEGVEDCVLSSFARAPSMIAKEGVVGSSRKEEALLSKLCGRLFAGVFKLDRDIHTPSISTPLSRARIPNGASSLFVTLASIIAGVGSRSLASTLE